MILTDITFLYKKLKVYVGQGSKSCKNRFSCSFIEVVKDLIMKSKVYDHVKYTISLKYTIPTETFSLKV